MSQIITSESHRAKALMREKVTRQELLGSFMNCMKEIDNLKAAVAQLQKVVSFHDNMIALFAEKIEIKPPEFEAFMEKRAKAILEAMREEAVRKGEDPDKVGQIIPNTPPAENNLPKSFPTCEESRIIIP